MPSPAAASFRGAGVSRSLIMSVGTNVAWPTRREGAIAGAGARDAPSLDRSGPKSLTRFMNASVAPGRRLCLSPLGVILGFGAYPPGHAHQRERGKTLHLPA